MSNFLGPFFSSQLNWVFPLCVKGFFFAGGVLLGGAVLSMIVIAVLKNVCPHLTAKSRFLSWLILDYAGRSASADETVITILIKGEHYDFLERMHGTQPHKNLSRLFVINLLEEIAGITEKDLVQYNRAQNEELVEHCRQTTASVRAMEVMRSWRNNSARLCVVLDNLMSCPTLTMDAMMSGNGEVLNEILRKKENHTMPKEIKKLMKRKKDWRRKFKHFKPD